MILCGPPSVPANPSPPSSASPMMVSGPSPFWRGVSAGDKALQALHGSILIWIYPALPPISPPLPPLSPASGSHLIWSHFTELVTALSPWQGVLTYVACVGNFPIPKAPRMMLLQSTKA